jgi:AbrB family looped-hinge helix DNA binding protein
MTFDLNTFSFNLLMINSLHMTSKIVTITSKNQITLPADYVRKLSWQKNRQLVITQRGNEIVLKAQPSLEQAMAPIWEEMRQYIKHPMNDAELKDAIRESFATRWTELQKAGRA